MTTTSKAAETARRNLTQRIERYLELLGNREGEVGVARQLGWREGDHLEKALAHLEAETFDEGERDTLWAEWASRQPDAVEPHPSVTPEDLKKRLAMIEGQPRSTETAEGKAVIETHRSRT